MKTIYYDTKGGGYRFHYENWPAYIGYSWKDAVSNFRHDYGLKKKHIKFINEADRPSLSAILSTSAGIKALNDLKNGTC